MARMGRPKKPINWIEFEKLCQMQCTEIEVAAWFNCSIDTIHRAVKFKYKRTFAEVFVEKKQFGRISLRRTMLQKANDGNPALLIFLAKNYLGMADRVENTIQSSKDPEKKLVIEFTLEQPSDDKI